jgi:hypothetical protein
MHVCLCLFMFAMSIAMIMCGGRCGGCFHHIVLCISLLYGVVYIYIYADDDL